MDTNKILEKILNIENPTLTPSGRLDIPPTALRCSGKCSGCYNYFISQISPYQKPNLISCYSTKSKEAKLYISTGKWKQFRKPIDELSESDYLELLELILRYYDGESGLRV